MNPFMNEPKDYKRRINMKEAYLTQASFIVSKELGIPLEEATEEVKAYLNETGINPVVLKHTDKDKNQDTFETRSNILSYVDYVIKKGYIMVPSFTVYLPPRIKKSSISGYVNNNLALRNHDKKEAKHYRRIGDEVKFLFFNTLQKTRKLKSNALSGGFLSHSPLENPSAHTALTSTTRMAASLGNIVAESILAGNRAYMAPNDVYSHFATLLTNVEREPVRKMVEKYGLKIPTTENIISMVLLSTNRYFNDLDFTKRLVGFVNTLDDIEKCIILYVQDLYHLRLLNDDFVRGMIGDLSRRESGMIDEDILSKLEDYEKNLLHYLLSTSIKMDDFSVEKIKGSPLYDTYMSTAVNMHNYIEYYSDFMKVFFAQNVMPINVGKMKYMVRDVDVLSDTDSTCSTYFDFVRWFIGDDTNDKEGKSVAITGTVGIFVSETLANLLYQFTTNMGVEEKQRPMLSMKNEYYWSVFLPANVAKHYVALTKIIEGDVLMKRTVEKKGANLIASTLSPYYSKKLENFITGLLIKLDAGRKISIKTYVNYVLNMEKEIIESIRKGDPNVLRLDTIKSFDSYKSDKVELTNYYHHELWNEVFADKYGNSPDPQYRVYKVNLTLRDKKRIDAFIDSIEDKEIQEKFRRFMGKYKKNALGMLRLPIENITNHGLPEEIVPVLDVKSLISNITTPFYIVLELIGYHVPEGKILLELEENDESVYNTDL